MTSPEAERSLIDEIDDRQEALLNDLASLNTRVEALLNDCLAAREQERLAGEADLEPLLVPGSATLAGPSVLISQSPAAVAAPQEC